MRLEQGLVECAGKASKLCRRYTIDYWYKTSWRNRLVFDCRFLQATACGCKTLRGIQRLFAMLDRGGRSLFEKRRELGPQFRIDRVLVGPAAAHFRYVRQCEGGLPIG